MRYIHGIVMTVLAELAQETGFMCSGEARVESPRVGGLPCGGTPKRDTNRGRDASCKVGSRLQNVHRDAFGCADFPWKAFNAHTMQLEGLRDLAKATDSTNCAGEKR